MAEKKPRIVKEKEFPVLGSEINPEYTMLTMEPAPYMLFKGRSATAKEFFEKDVLRLKESLKPGRVEPNFAMVPKGPHEKLRANVDLRTGMADIAVLLPEKVKIPAPAVSDDLPPLTMPLNHKRKI